MTETESRARAAIRSGRRRTAITLFFVGGGTGALGAFMAALDLFDLDAEFRNASTAAHVALWGFALLFMAVGFGMVLMSVLGRGGAGRQAERLMFDHPSQIAGAWRQVSTGKAIKVTDNELAGGSHALVVQSRDGKAITVMMNALEVTRSLEWIREVAPDAVRQPS